MRVLICSGTADPASALASALGAAGDEVHLLVPERGDARLPSYRSGDVTVTNAGEYPPLIPEDDRLARALQANLSLLDRGTIALTEQPFDVVNAYGVQTVYAAGALGRLFDIPVVATVLPVPRALPIAGHWARWLTTDAARVIVTSSSTGRRVEESLGVPAHKIVVIRPSRAATPGGRAHSLAMRTRAVYEAVVTERASRPRARRPSERRPGPVRLGSAPAAR